MNELRNVSEEELSQVNGGDCPKKCTEDPTWMRLNPACGDCYV
jgi:bacteriocin-like protein